jgi:hypothetical protein
MFADRKCYRQSYLHSKLTRTLQNIQYSPSIFELDLPSSSIITKESEVTRSKMYATSFISTEKLLRLFSMSSVVPMRDKTLLRIGIRADLAGTKQPICARMIIIATCLIKTVYFRF